jgi:hypothetical protein
LWVHPGVDVVLHAGTPEVVRGAARHADGFAPGVPCLLEVTETRLPLGAVKAGALNATVRLTVDTTGSKGPMACASDGLASRSLWPQPLSCFPRRPSPSRCTSDARTVNPDATPTGAAMGPAPSRFAALTVAFPPSSC